MARSGPPGVESYLVALPGHHHHLETEINKYQHSGPGAAFKLHFMYSNPVLSVWGTVVESVLAPHRRDKSPPRCHNFQLILIAGSCLPNLALLQLSASDNNNQLN